MKVQEPEPTYLQCFSALFLLKAPGVPFVFLLPFFFPSPPPRVQGQLPFNPISRHHSQALQQLQGRQRGARMAGPAFPSPGPHSCGPSPVVTPLITGKTREDLIVEEAGRRQHLS